MAAAPARDDGRQVDRILRLLGLGIRGRGAVVGIGRVRDAARSGTLALAVVASDASPHSLDKLLPLLRARQHLVERMRRCDKLLPLLRARRINFFEVPSAAA